MATFWDALRADTLLQLLKAEGVFDDTTASSGDTYQGIATFADGSYGYGFIRKHFDTIKGSIALFGPYSLIVEATDEGNILVGLLKPGNSSNPSFVSDSASFQSLRSDIHAVDASTVDFKKVYESFLKAAREAFKASNGLETDGEKLMGGGGGMGVAAIPQVEGMSAAENIRLMMTLQSLNMGDGDASRAPQISPSKAAFQDAVEGLCIETLRVAIPSPPPSSTLKDVTDMLYRGLVDLSGAISREMVVMAQAKRASDGVEAINGDVIALFSDPVAFLAAVISHQRRYLSNPGALGPRVAFPLSVFDQCLAYLDSTMSDALSERFMALRNKVEFPHLNTTASEEDICPEDEAAFEAMMRRTATPASYFTTLRLL